MPKPTSVTSLNMILQTQECNLIVEHFETLSFIQALQEKPFKFEQKSSSVEAGIVMCTWTAAIGTVTLM